MLDLEQLRRLQESRLTAALQAWEQEKQRLQEAVARAEAKEHDYREVADDVKQRLAALDLVALMNQELTPALQAPAPQALTPQTTLAPQALPPVPVPQAGPPATVGSESMVRSSSRPLFPDRRGRVLCILP